MLTARWNQDMEFGIELEQGEKMVLTSVPKEKRPGPGPSPVESVPAALAACTGMDIVMILRKMRKTLESLRIDVDWVRRDEEPRILTRIDLEFHVDGPDLDERSVHRAVELSQEKYCSVAAMLRPTVEMGFRIVLNGKPVEAATSS